MVYCSVWWGVDLSVRPYILKVMLDRLSVVSPSEVVERLWGPALLYFVMTAWIWGMYRIYNYFIEVKFVPVLRKHIGVHVVGNFLEQSHEFYQNNFSGSVAKRVNDLTTNIPEVISITLDRFLPPALGVIMLSVVLWTINWKFALLLVSWVLFAVMIALVNTRRLENYSDKYHDLCSVITGKMVDALGNILPIRLFSRQKFEYNSIAESYDEAVVAEQRFHWLYFLIWVVYAGSFLIMEGLVLFFLITGYRDGVITVGDFGLILPINIAMGEIMWRLMSDFSTYARDMGNISQALRAVEVPMEVVDVPDAKTLVAQSGKIEFRNVAFFYKNNSKLFQDKSVVIEPGQRVGLVGYSGGGKTTFVNLIERLYDVTSGAILIDGQDIRGVTQESLRNNIAMVPQDPSLFHRSLMDNIRYGNLNASEADVIEVARKTHVHEFITQLPEGYETHVGERGVKLSGGQRQRIAIARALLKNAPIFILDEATSQLDSITESMIQTNLWELIQGKTTIVIAHRLSTLLHMDRVLVFDRGHIVEDGSHGELLARGGLYKKLWDTQVGGFLLDDIAKVT
jgi:ATP-binding cassette subfamily B protein